MESGLLSLAERESHPNGASRIPDELLTVFRDSQGRVPSLKHGRERLLDRWPPLWLPGPLRAQGHRLCLGNWRATSISSRNCYNSSDCLINNQWPLVPGVLRHGDNKQRIFVLRAGQSNEPATMRRNISKHFYQAQNNLYRELGTLNKDWKAVVFLDSKFPPAWLAGKSSDTGDRLSSPGSLLAVSQIFSGKQI